MIAMASARSTAPTARLRGRGRRRVGSAALFSGVCAASLAYSSTAGARNGASLDPPAGLIRPDYWSKGAPRVFVSSRLEGGLVYAKPQVAVGYGRPFWSW